MTFQGKLAQMLSAAAGVFLHETQQIGPHLLILKLRWLLNNLSQLHRLLLAAIAMLVATAMFRCLARHPMTCHPRARELTKVQVELPGQGQAPKMSWTRLTVDSKVPEDAEVKEVSSVMHCAQPPRGNH